MTKFILKPTLPDFHRSLQVRTDHRFPSGFMDVIQIDKTGENFRLIYDVKGRFTTHRITNQEAKYKLCRVKAVKTGPKNVPYLYTSDGRTIRYPDPLVKVRQLSIQQQGSVISFMIMEPS